MCLYARLGQNAVPVPAQKNNVILNIISPFKNPPCFHDLPLCPTCSLSLPSQWADSSWHPCSLWVCTVSLLETTMSRADLWPAPLGVPARPAALRRGRRSAWHLYRPRWGQGEPVQLKHYENISDLILKHFNGIITHMKHRKQEALTNLLPARRSTLALSRPFVSSSFTTSLMISEPMNA